MKRKSVLVVILAIVLGLAIIIAASVTIINTYVKSIGVKNIITLDEAAELNDIDCILVLGCLVKSDGNPSDMLADRIKGGVALYDQGSAPKIIMSGDHGTKAYDEVNAMKKIAIDAGVPSNDIFMDHAGFSTYESIYRAKEIFGAEKIIIVTQEYHLYRSLYIAEKLGIEAYGVSADYRTYSGQIKRDVREVLARFKDFATVLIKPKPTYLGETIPISGDGNITND